MSNGPSWVHPRSGLTLIIKHADGSLAALWRGDAEGFPPFVVGSPDTEARIYKFLGAFEPAGFADQPMASWSRLVDKYAPGGLEAELGGEDFVELYRSALTCTRGDRVIEGIVLLHEAGMVRLCNELRRRILA